MYPAIFANQNNWVAVSDLTLLTHNWLVLNSCATGHKFDRDLLLYPDPHLSRDFVALMSFTRAVAVSVTTVADLFTLMFIIMSTDHGPVDMTLRFKSKGKGRSTRRRLNTSQLQNENSCQFVYDKY